MNYSFIFISEPSTLPLKDQCLSHLLTTTTFITHTPSVRKILEWCQSRTEATDHSHPSSTKGQKLVVNKFQQVLFLPVQYPVILKLTFKLIGNEYLTII